MQYVEFFSDVDDAVIKTKIRRYQKRYPSRRIMQTSMLMQGDLLITLIVFED